MEGRTFVFMVEQGAAGYYSCRMDMSGLSKNENIVRLRQGERGWRMRRREPYIKLI
jgi:hypothetical protein